jgi:hypothetical protein
MARTKRSSLSEILAPYTPPILLENEINLNPHSMYGLHRSSLPLRHGHVSSGDSRIISSLRHFQTSMVLLQVNMPRVAVVPFEGDAPRSVDVKAVAQRLPRERMEIEARNVEIAQHRGVFQRIQSPKRPVLEVRSHSSASAFAKQVIEPLVAEAPYHPTGVTHPATSVNRCTTVRLKGLKDKTAGGPFEAPVAWI